jgi:hypothetical protein
MPRFFFDLYNDTTVTDDEGQEFPDLQTARVEAVKQVRKLIGGLVVENGTIDLLHFLQLRDEDGNIVHRIEFREAVRFLRGGRPVSPP